MTDPLITEEVKSAMGNGIPPVLTTCSAEGIPNATFISQMYYVDQEHIALSFQFFNKTKINVQENPKASVLLTDNKGSWVLEIQFQHSEKEGPVFDEMDMQIEALASATGMAGVFSLKAADIYTVHSIRKIPNSAPA